MVPKYVIDVSIIWLNDNIYLRNTWFPTTDVQTQNIGKLRYANRRAPTECRHTVATQATEYQRWRDVGCRSRRCRLMPTLGQRRNASWEVLRREWRCSWSSADRRCSNYIWFISNFIAHYGASYIRDVTVRAVMPYGANHSTHMIEWCTYCMWCTSMHIAHRCTLMHIDEYVDTIEFVSLHELIMKLYKQKLNLVTSFQTIRAHIEGQKCCFGKANN